MMGIIFGRKNCHYNTDWIVKLNLRDQQHIIVAEQLREKEAKKIYDKIKEQLKSKDGFIEVQTEQTSKTNRLEFFQKKHILSVEIYRD